MNQGFAGSLIVVAAVGGQVLTAGATQLTPVAGFRELLKSAEAVAAVKILKVDNRATAADGPLILEVKVLAVPKGRVTVGQTLRTWESAWVAGTYRTGQRRREQVGREEPRQPQGRGRRGAQRGAGRGAQWGGGRGARRGVGRWREGGVGSWRARAVSLWGAGVVASAPLADQLDRASATVPACAVHRECRRHCACPSAVG